MLEVIGWLVLGIGCLWLTGFTFFATIPTFGQALFAQGSAWWEKLLGGGLWVLTAFAWYKWVSVVTISFNVST